MNWGEILTYLMEAIISIAIPMLFVLIKRKVKNETALKLISQAEQLAINCVMCVEQTFVLPMKHSNNWDKEACEQAYEACKEQLLLLLNDETIKAIETVYSDLEIWCKTQIETGVMALRLEEE